MSEAPIETRVEEVARRLSDAQREALLFGLRGYFDPNTIRALRRKGLFARGLLTEFGIEVGDYLRTQPDRPA